MSRIHLRRNMAMFALLALAAAATAAPVRVEGVGDFQILILQTDSEIAWKFQGGIP